ncbi:hypothetical protein [Kiloniella antarctica]|uniref:Uncharacterized protein n=1 Tax=Kiloniella antarctica TaxID=1550907 RepID=A0ABW5BKK1_9PROT
MLRHYCQSYADPSSHAWDKVFVLGEDELGPYDGAWVVSAVGSFIRSIRNGRKRSFEFIVSCCPICRLQICTAELNALWLVQAARTENVIGMETAAILTLDGHNTQDLISSAHHLGSVLREVFPEEREHRYKPSVTGYPGSTH